MGFFANALGALGKVGNVIDLPASSVRDVLAWENPFDQWATPTQSKNRMYGRDVLQRWGVLGENTPGLDLGDIAGGAFDLATDPFNLGAAAWAGKTARAGARARAANVGIQQANDLSNAMRAKGALPAEKLSKATKVYRANQMGDMGHPTESILNVPGARTPDPYNYDEATMLGHGPEPMFDGVPVPIGLDDIWDRLDLFPTYAAYKDLGKLTPDDLEGIAGIAEDLSGVLPGTSRRGLKPNQLAGVEVRQFADELASDRLSPNRLLNSQSNANFQLSQFKDDVLDQLRIETDRPLPGSDLYGAGNMDDYLQDDFLDLLKGDPSDPLTQQAKMLDELEQLNRYLSSEVDRVIQPSPKASQSFYKTTGKSKKTGKEMEKLYLPYVAPALQALMNVPKVPKGRLAALLGTHNALSRPPYQR